MLGLIIAEKDESNALVKALNTKIIEFNGIRYYIGTYKDKKVVIAFSGIGKANAAMTAMNMIINFGVTKIFNVGLAGSCRKDVVPGTTVIPNSIEYGDVDLTPFGYEINNLPDTPSRFTIKQEYVDFLKSICKNFKVGVVASSDSVIALSNVSKFPTLANKEIACFDMELAAIAHVCYKTGVDIFSLKLVSDNLMFDETSKKQYDTNYKTLAKQIEKYCLQVLDNYLK